MKSPRTFGNPESDASQRMGIEQMAKVVAGNVSFGATKTQNNTDRDINIDCYKVSGQAPGVANTEFAIAHNLKRVPIGYFYNVDQPAIIYQLANTGTAWTAATATIQGNIFVKCSVALVNFFIVII